MGFDVTVNRICSAPRKAVLAALIAGVAGGITGPVHADSYDVLLEKLRTKGVISDSEYQEFQTLREDDMKSAGKPGKDEARIKFKDGFTLESADGASSLSIEGRMHADYRSFSEDGPGSSAADTFDIRRAFLGVKGTFYKDWSFEVTGDLSADSLEYAYLDYKTADAAQIRVGAFKMPYSFEELTSSRFIDFQERSLVNALVPGKEQGLMIYGEPIKGQFGYALALSNGSGKEGDESNAQVDGKDLIARVAGNLAAFTGMPDAVIHLGLNYATGTIPAAALTGGVRTEGRGLTFFTAASPGGTEIDRDRLGLEGVFAYGPFKLQSEWVNASFQSNAPGATERELDAYYASVNWMITGEKYADNYTINGMRAIKPNNPFKKGGGMGAWELGLRYSKWDAGDLATGEFTGTKEADAITLGLKWIPVTPVRFYLNYTQTDFDTPIATATGTTDDEKAVTLRAAVFF